MAMRDDAMDRVAVGGGTCTVEEVVENTGFEIDVAANVSMTPRPTPEHLSLLRSSIKEKVAGIYPAFVEGGGFGA